MHQNNSIWINLRQKAAHFFFADLKFAIAEKKINLAADLQIEDVSYFQHPGGALVARIYRPRSRAPRAALVSVHGGRWTRETRLTNAPIDEALARDGNVVMAIDFRMPPVARYPDCVADINLAIRWLKRHAAELGCGAGPVGGIGTSSE